MREDLKSHIADLEKFNTERVFWLRLSGFVVISVLVLLLDWKIVEHPAGQWMVVAAGLIVSVLWWYWTMRLIRRVIAHRSTEIEILADIVKDIKEIREDVKKLDQRT